MSNLAQYLARSPRYILQPQDNTLIRVAGPKQVPWEEATEIKNISLTGLSFTAPTELCPLIGEMIKIQFEVPGGEQMACLGIVSRLQPTGTSEMLVGVHFHKLEIAHRVVLAQGIAKKLQEQQERKASIVKRNFKLHLLSNLPKVLLTVALLGSWGYLIYVLSIIFSKT